MARSVTHAVILAAGRGERLAPVTDTLPKPLLPIDGMPVLISALSACVDLGIHRVTVVVGHLGNVIESALRDARIPRSGGPDPYRTDVDPGDLAPVMAALDLSVVQQDAPLGTADAFAVARAGFPTAGPAVPDGVLVMAADTVFRTDDLHGMVRTYELTEHEDGPVAIVGVLERPAAELAERSLVAVDGLRVTSFQEKPGQLDADTGLSGVPAYVLSSSMAPYLDALEPSVRGTLDLPDALHAAVEAGEQITANRFAGTRDLTRLADLLAENFPYIQWLAAPAVASDQ